MSKRKPGARRMRPAVNDQETWVDPIPRPLNVDDNDIWFLEQVTKGRWLDTSIPAEVRFQIARLAEHIAHRGSHQFFGDSPTAIQINFLQMALEFSYQRGYFLAVLRYENDLKHVPELAAWRKERADGGDKGRDSQRKAKLERAARARAMLANGDDVPDIAAALNVTVSTVYRLLNLANGKPAKRSKRARKR